MDQHYFVSAVVPKDPVGTCVFAPGAVKGSGVTAVVVPVEAARKLSLNLYSGPTARWPSSSPSSPAASST